MSVKDKGISISIGLVFSIISGVGAHFTAKSDAQTERAVMMIKIDYQAEEIKALKATDPKLVAERVKVLGETVKEIKSDQKTMLTLMNEIYNHSGS